MRTTEEIRNYLINTFTDFEGIKTVIVGGYDEVTESVLNDMTYPLLWIMYPFSRKPFMYADEKRHKWQLEGLILMEAKFDETEKTRQNFDDTQILGEKFIAKLKLDADTSHGVMFDFDDVDNVDEWQPKTQYGNDNCNGFLITFSIITT